MQCAGWTIKSADKLAEEIYKSLQYQQMYILILCISLTN